MFERSDRPGLAKTRPPSPFWGVAWTGCPAILSCLHYLKERRGRVTAPCEACARAREKMRMLKQQAETEEHLEHWFRCDECGAEQEEDSACKECGCEGMVPFQRKVGE